ncbi:MAG: tRNA 4-thiouridine(8) synthase ThiI [Candidatus Omnitrophica bacterium]|nr:tRNA 4-thiouridine(8) synthase ThiI [Candidatus Omnitrophota bacterium]
MQKRPKAVALLSGGLDSILAIKLIQQQGIEVTALSFVTPFFGSKHAQNAARQLKVPLIVKDITKELFPLVKNPKFGYGKTMNPCIDCHSLMMKIAGDMMKKSGFDFIVTGEVLGERPMSQNRKSLEVVAQHCGYAKYILRPLSAKLLAPTEPEMRGLVDRNRLLDIQGRSRKIQIALAKDFGVVGYPNPAGGCLLTDEGFSRKLKDLLRHRKNPHVRELELLKIGRHFRLNKNVKLIVGRNEKENQRLRQLRLSKDAMLFLENIPGPTAVLLGPKSARTYLKLAAEICAAYSDTKEDEQYPVVVQDENKRYCFPVKVNRKSRGLYPTI